MFNLLRGVIFNLLLSAARKPPFFHIGAKVVTVALCLGFSAKGQQNYVSNIG